MDTPLLDEAAVRTSPGLFTPKQAAVAALLGGPVAGSLLMAMNYHRLENASAFRKTLALGIIISIVMSAIVAAISLLLTNGNAGAGAAIAFFFYFKKDVEKNQGTEIAASKAAGLKFAPWWLVILLSLGGFAFSLGIGVIVFLILSIFIPGLRV